MGAILPGPKFQRTKRPGPKCQGTKRPGPKCQGLNVQVQNVGAKRPVQNVRGAKRPGPKRLSEKSGCENTY